MSGGPVSKPGERPEFYGRWACRLCRHDQYRHNLIEGCPYCRCAATPGEASARTEPEMHLTIYPPSRFLHDWQDPHHKHVWERRQNVTTHGTVMKPYEVCILGCGEARPAVDPDPHAECKKRLAAVWAIALGQMLDDRLSDGTPVMQVVLDTNPHLKDRLRRLLGGGGR